MSTSNAEKSTEQTNPNLLENPLYEAPEAVVDLPKETPKETVATIKDDPLPRSASVNLGEQVQLQGWAKVQDGLSEVISATAEQVKTEAEKVAKAAKNQMTGKNGVVNAAGAAILGYTGWSLYRDADAIAGVANTTGDYLGIGVKGLESGLNTFASGTTDFFHGDLGFQGDIKDAFNSLASNPIATAVIASVLTAVIIAAASQLSKPKQGKEAHREAGMELQNLHVTDPDQDTSALEEGARPKQGGK